MHYLQAELYDRIANDRQILDFLQSSSLDGLWYWDLEKPEHEWMNESFWTTLGYDPEQMPHLAAAWQDIIHPDDLQTAIDNFNRHCEDPSVPYDQVVRYRHREGGTVYIRCRGMAIRDETGKPVRMLGAHVDVTEAKRKEALLEEVNDVARVGVWEVDLKNNNVWWSKTTRDIHEVGPDFEPKISDGLLFYKAGEHRDNIRRLVKRAMERGEGFDTEAIIITVSGRELWVRAVGNVTFFEGKINRFNGVFMDIDERKRTEEKLLAYSILEAKANEMEQFAYAASHDLREPLLTISGYLEALDEDYGDRIPAEGREFLQIIRAAASRMDSLIRGMLDYSRHEQDKQLQDVNVNELIGDVIDDLGARIKQTGATIEVANFPQLRAYPLDLKMLLQNLLSNALKFAHPDRPPHIHIRGEATGNAYRIDVIDNGRGIPVKDRQRVFQLFRTLQAKRDDDSMGIGLSQVKKITELHNGTVWIEDTPGGGTTVSFTINT